MLVSPDFGLITWFENVYIACEVAVYDALRAFAILSAVQPCLPVWEAAELCAGSGVCSQRLRFLQHVPDII